MAKCSITTWGHPPLLTTQCCPEIAVAKIREDAPFEKVCYIGCGVTTGIGAVINTLKLNPGARVVVFGLGGIGLKVIQGARMVGASQIVGVGYQS
jgi:S-(hydroxymethyl)glutathione dehydrogenase/alcohol dehydrogenase